MLKRMLLPMFLIGMFFSANAMNLGEGLENPFDLGDLAQRSENLLVRVFGIQESDEEISFREEYNSSVDYNSEQNSIVACHNSDSSDDSRSVTMTIAVIKYLDTDCFEVDASRIENTEEGMSLFLSDNADLSIVEKLKEDIAEFERNM